MRRKFSGKPNQVRRPGLAAQLDQFLAAGDNSAFRIGVCLDSFAGQLQGSSTRRRRAGRRNCRGGAPGPQGSPVALHRSAGLEHARLVWSVTILPDCPEPRSARVGHSWFPRPSSLAMAGQSQAASGRLLPTAQSARAAIRFVIAWLHRFRPPFSGPSSDGGAAVTAPAARVVPPGSRPPSRPLPRSRPCGPCSKQPSQRHCG